MRKVVYGFVSLDSIPLEPHFRAARQTGDDRGRWSSTRACSCSGLQAAAWRVPFLPTRAGLGSDVFRDQPELRTVARRTTTARSSSRCRRCTLDVALVHMNRARRGGNGQFLGPDLYFDDLFVHGGADRHAS